MHEVRITRFAGQRQLPLTRINAVFAANDRIKHHFSALQMVRMRALKTRLEEAPGDPAG